jgi:hypothetical protein
MLCSWIIIFNVMIKNIKLHNFFILLTFQNLWNLIDVFQKNYENVQFKCFLWFFKVRWVHENQGLTFLMVPLHEWVCPTIIFMSKCVTSKILKNYKQDFTTIQIIEKVPKIFGTMGVKIKYGAITQKATCKYIRWCVHNGCHKKNPNDQANPID